MFSRNRQKPQSRIDTLIGAETTVDGDINFSGGLRVDGQIRGNVNEVGGKSGTLVLSEHGQIEGAITVSHAVINGAVVGPVNAAADQFYRVQVGPYADVKDAEAMRARLIGDGYNPIVKK